MVKSMTAFAREVEPGDWGAAQWEVRSVNHRYLELSFRLPENLRELESVLREKVRGYLHRGKVECQCKFQPGSAVNAELKVNHSLAQQLIAAGNELSSQVHGNASCNLIDVLKWPGVIQVTEAELESAQAHILQSFEAALEKLCAARETEARALVEVLNQKADEMLLHIDTVRKAMPNVLKELRERIQGELQKLTSAVDNNRLEQEMVYYAQKMDVAEEVDRLYAHVKEVKRVLKIGGPVGRRLDFLMQELNREANTLASKSQAIEVTKAAVELKVLIEQMREQVQNIE